MLNTETALKSSVLRWSLILENDHWNTKWKTIYMALFLCTDFLEIKKILYKKGLAEHWVLTIKPVKTWHYITAVSSKPYIRVMLSHAAHSDLHTDKLSYVPSPVPVLYFCRLVVHVILSTDRQTDRLYRRWCCTSTPNGPERKRWQKIDQLLPEWCALHLWSNHVHQPDSSSQRLIYTATKQLIRPLQWYTQ